MLAMLVVFTVSSKFLAALLAALSVAVGLAATPNLKHTWTTSIRNDSASVVAGDPPLVLTGDAEVNFCVQIPAGETAEVDAPVTVADIVSAFINCTQAATVKTNASDGSGGQSITLTANKSVSWHNQMQTSCPFTPNITKFFIHNTGSSTATARGGFLLQE
jgi:hypothetical protein